MVHVYDLIRHLFEHAVNCIYNVNTTHVSKIVVMFALVFQEHPHVIHITKALSF